MSLENSFGRAENIEERLKIIDSENNRELDGKELAKTEFELELALLDQKKKLNEKDVLRGADLGAKMFAEGAVKLKEQSNA